MKSKNTVYHEKRGQRIYNVLTRLSRAILCKKFFSYIPDYHVHFHLSVSTPGIHFVTVKRRCVDCGSIFNRTIYYTIYIIYVTFVYVIYYKIYDSISLAER